MNKRLLVLSFILILVACQKFAPPDPKGDSSSHDEDESHHTGENCMDCHYSAGYAEGIFTVAGSVFGNYRNSNIELFKNTNEPAIKRIQVDLLGNLYTPDDLDFSEGLFVGVRNQNGDLQLMEGQLFHGQCNLCHGTSRTGRIIIE